MPEFATEPILGLLPRRPPQRLLCFASAGMAMPRSIAGHYPAAQVTCFFLDAFHLQAARDSNDQLTQNLQLVCDCDLPLETYELVILPVSVSGEAELTRDWLQQSHERLVTGGYLITVVDNANDRWLHEQVEKLFGRLRRVALERAAAYVARKEGPLRKQKQFACEFSFRDQGRLLKAFSRPGVFSHRRIDGGARQLIDAMQIADGQRVLDIGCGSGTVALAAAVRAPGVSVHAIDSNARAVHCTRIGAERNGCSNLSAELAIAGQWARPDGFDLALANPPYYASFRISQAFLWSAQNSLRPGGRMIAVTKAPEWYVENAPQWFEDVQIEAAKSYFVVRGRKPVE